MYDESKLYPYLPPLRGIAGMPAFWSPNMDKHSICQNLAPRDLVRIRLHGRVRPAAVIQVGHTSVRVEVNGALFHISREDVISLDRRADGRSLGAAAPVG